MTTSTSTSTAGPDGAHRAAPGPSLAAHLAHIAIAYGTFGKVVADAGDVPLGPSAGPVFSAQLEHDGVRFTAYIRDGVLTIDVPDPDLAQRIATMAGLPAETAHSTRYLQFWRGQIADYPTVLVGRGPQASLLTDAILRRVLADINDGQLLDVTA